MRPGLHLSNCSPITVADEDIVKRWAPLSALLAMNNIVEDEGEIGKLVRLWEVAGRPLLVLRKYFEPADGAKAGRWGVHAMESVIMARRCMARGIPAGKIALKPFNEPNMPTWACNEPYGEGFGDQEEHIERYGKALATFIDVAKNEEPDVLIGGPHLTVGNHDVRFPNDAEGRYYYGPNSLCQYALDRLDLHFVHCYGFRRGQYQDRAHGLRFLEYEKFLPRKPIYIVEGCYGIQWENGNAIDPAHNNVRGEDTVAYLRLLDQYPQVKGITFWIGGWTGWQEHRHSDDAGPGSHRPVVFYVEQYVKGELPGPAPPLTPQPQPVPIPTPEEPTDMEYAGLSEEMKARLTVRPADTTKAYWKIVKVQIQPQTDNQSAWVIAPAGHEPTLFWSGGEAIMPWKAPDPYTPPGTRDGAYSQPMFHSWASYGVHMDGNSEALFGFGLYGDPPALELAHTAHHPVLVYFQLVEGGAEPAPEPPPVTPPGPEPVPEPEPIPSIPYEFGSALGGRLVAAGLGKLVDVRDAIEKKYMDASKVGTRNVDAKDRVAGFWSITFHHDKIKYPLNVDAIAKDHVTNPDKLFGHIAYHFLINTDGTVWWVKRLKYYGSHSGNARFNKYSIPVAVHGDFTSESPSVGQLKALKCVTEALEEWVGEHQGKPQPLPIVRHKDIVNTECPGNLYETYMRWRRL